MELVPLPTSELAALLLYWNPEQGRLVGEGSELVVALVDRALQQGLTGDMAGMELTSPLHKPSELAAILSQFWLVIPEPVADLPVLVQAGSQTLN